MWNDTQINVVFLIKKRKIAGFGGEYFEVSEDEDNGTVPKKDKSFLQAYKSVLNTKANEESLVSKHCGDIC